MVATATPDERTLVPQIWCADHTQPLTELERRAGVVAVDHPARQYRTFTDDSEDASGDGIVYADESEYEYAYRFYED